MAHRKRYVFWKNLIWKLIGRRRLIYNGLKAFDDLENFYYEDEIFEILYNLSAGIERLEKNYNHSY